MEDKVEKHTHSEQQKEKRLKKNEDDLRELWDNMKQQYLHHRDNRRRKSKQGIEHLFEKIMTENFPNLVKEKVTQVQEAQRVLIKLNPKMPTRRHIIIKMAKFKDKERILKAAREKQSITYMGASIRLTAYFSTETLQARRNWHEVFKVMTSKDVQPTLLYPARLSFKN